MTDLNDATASGGMTIDRRSFLATSSLTIASATAPALGASAAPWNAGDVVHILPTSSHNRILIKCSLRRAISNGVTLRVGNRTIPGQRGDHKGLFWSFTVEDLAPATRYSLSIWHGSRALCADWPLTTFPAPDSSPDRFRLLTFTCAGGHERQRGPDGAEVFRPMDIRRRLLARAMSFEPQAVIANGDHIYWDQKTGAESTNAAWAKGWKDLYAGFRKLDHDKPMSDPGNVDAIVQLGNPQIAGFYGVTLRSAPTFFVGDDHDYFENDEANERQVTFPPTDFMVRAKQAVQKLFYPEMLPDPKRPTALSGTREDGLSENFGTLRYGKLFEALIYDCGQWLDLKGPVARIVPEEVEDWLVARTVADDTRHLLHVPSTPMGWSAGKWREWYPDVVVEERAPVTKSGDTRAVLFKGTGARTKLTTERPKYMWQPGWFAQHQRLLKALSSNHARPAVMISGDLHAVGWEKIERSADLDLSANPVHSILAGPIGTSTWAWPSHVRGIHAVPPATLTIGGGSQPVEKNGFTIIDVTPDEITFRLFAWREPQLLDAIDTLEPYQVVRLSRKGVV